MATLGRTQFLPPSEANALVNESIADLHDILVSRAEDYFVRSAELQPLGDGETWRLPDDMYKLRALYVDGASVEPYTENQRESAAVGSSSRYALRGEGVSVLPANVAGAVTLRYVPQAPQLHKDADTLGLAFASGWDSYVVYDVAVKMRIKAKQDASALQARADRAQARIIQMAAQRDSGQPRQVRDVYGFAPLSHARRMWGFL
jgi:hypothetical protein